MSGRNLLLFFSTCFLSSTLPLLAQEVEREILPVEINSPYIEIRPLINGDGTVLYFGRREHPDNMQGESDMQDIWMVEQVDGVWGSPKNLGEPVNNKYVNSLCSVSPDGQELLLFNTYKKVEGPLARMQKQGQGWSEPLEVKIENYYNHSEYLDFYQSYANKVLFMALEREDTRGEQDLYVSFLENDGSWSKPKNLGAMVNTKKSDFAPFLASDGKTLFFSSYGIKGKGGADIFYTQRLDDTWTKWSKPVNVGAPINTSGEETYCSLTDDMRSIFYVSYRHGSEKRDIYKSNLPPSLDQLGPNMKIEPVLAVNKDIKGIKTDKASQNSENISEGSVASLSQQADTNTTTTTTTEGTSINETLAAQQTRRVAVTAPASAPASTGKGPLALDIRHQQVASDIPNNVQYSLSRNIYFDFNQTRLKQDVYDALLAKLLVFLQENPAAQLKVVGHADEMGTPRANMTVSQLRAQQVKQYLHQQGIAAERILLHFRGETEPLASNDDEREGRELNRRVEFYILLPEA